MEVDRVAELERWVDSGARWQVLGRGARGITVSLLRCDGGEEMARFTSADSRLIAFIGDRANSDD